MQKSLNLLLLAVAFMFCSIAGAQTTADYKLKQQQFLQNLKTKNALISKFKHGQASQKTTSRSKADTKKVPATIASIYWSEEDNDWTDTSEINTITWGADGIPSQLTYYMPSGDNDLPEKIVVTDWFRIDKSLPNEFEYIFGGDENFMFHNAIGKILIAGQWVDYQRYTVKLNANNLVTEQLIEEFNGIKWINSSRTTFSYNQQNQETEIVDEEWKNGNWIGNYKATFVYDANGNEIENISYNWDGSWEKSYGDKSILTYNGNKQVTSIEKYYYESNVQDWLQMNKQTYTLNAAGEITEAIEYAYSGSTNEWVENNMYSNIVWQKFDNTYFYSQPIIIGGDDIKSYDKKYWTGTTWELSGRENNQYNAGGLQTLASFETYTNGLYKETEKRTTSYYANNDVKEYKYFSFKSDTVLEHIDGYDYVNTYDTDGDKTDEINRDWDTENSKYKNQYRTITTYTTTTTGLQDLPGMQNIAIYPNPAVNGKINISMGQSTSKSVQVIIYDNTGKAVYNALQNFANNITVDVSSLSKGLYFISVNSDNKVSKSRFTIQ